MSFLIVTTTEFQAIFSPSPEISMTQRASFPLVVVVVVVVVVVERTD